MSERARAVESTPGGAIKSAVNPPMRNGVSGDRTVAGDLDRNATMTTLGIVKNSSIAGTLNSGATRGFGSSPPDWAMSDQMRSNEPGKAVPATSPKAVSRQRPRRVVVVALDGAVMLLGGLGVALA